MRKVRCLLLIKLKVAVKENLLCEDFAEYSDHRSLAYNFHPGATAACRPLRWLLNSYRDGRIPGPV